MPRPLKCSLVLQIILKCIFAQIEELSKRVELRSAEHFELRAFAVKKLVALRRAQTDALDVPSVRQRD